MVALSRFFLAGNSGGTFSLSEHIGSRMEAAVLGLFLKCVVTLVFLLSQLCYCYQRPYPAVFRDYTSSVLGVISKGVPGDNLDQG